MARSMHSPNPDLPAASAAPRGGFPETPAAMSSPTDPIPAAAPEAIVALYTTHRRPEGRRGARLHDAAAPAFDPVLRTRPGEIWAALKKEPPSFWLFSMYIFFEYVRPQANYPALAAVPWGEMLLILSTVALVVESRPFRLPTLATPLLGLYTAIILLSAVVAYSSAASVDGLRLWLNWLLVYALMANIVTTERRYFIFMLAWLLYSFKMSQFGTRSWYEDGFAYRNWGTTGGTGWFANSGEFGIQMCMFLPLSVHFIVAMWKHWGPLKRAFFLLFPATTVLSIVGSSSRGALIGGGLILVWYLLHSKYRFRILVPAALLVTAVWMLIPPEAKTRLSVAGSDETSLSRLTLWRHGMEIVREHPVLGIGYYNWLPYYRTYYDPLGLLPHNIFIQAMAELGYTGLAAFILLIVGTFVVNAQTRRLLKRVPEDHAFLRHMSHGLDAALVGFLGAGFFVTVLYYPFFWVNLAMTVSLYVTAETVARTAGSTAAPPVLPAVPRGRGGLDREPALPAAASARAPAIAPW